MTQAKRSKAVSPPCAKRVTTNNRKRPSELYKESTWKFPLCDESCRQHCGKLQVLGRCGCDRRGPDNVSPNTWPPSPHHTDTRDLCFYLVGCRNISNLSFGNPQTISPEKNHSNLSRQIVHKQTYIAWINRNIHTFIQFGRKVDHVDAAG
jgi:hypothetical protein